MIGSAFNVGGMVAVNGTYAAWVIDIENTNERGFQYIVQQMVPLTKKKRQPIAMFPPNYGRQYAKEWDSLNWRD